jgi:hypothetical protein
VCCGATGALNYSQIQLTHPPKDIISERAETNKDDDVLYQKISKGTLMLVSTLIFAKLNSPCTRCEQARAVASKWAPKCAPPTWRSTPPGSSPRRSSTRSISAAVNVTTRIS